MAFLEGAAFIPRAAYHTETGRLTLQYAPKHHPVRPSLKVQVTSRPDVPVHCSGAREVGVVVRDVVQC